jgi:hypothetical protein
LFKPLVIKDKTFDDEFPKRFGRPDAETRGFHRVDAITDGNDRVQVIKIDFAGDLARALLLNYPEFPDS